MAATAQHQQVVVTTKQQFDVAVQQYIGMGYGPRQMTNDVAILVKAGDDKGLGCMFVFWLLVFFPIAIIMLVNQNKRAGDVTVTIRLDASGGTSLGAPAPAKPSMPTELVMSEDRQYWWDGGAWVRADQATPPMAKKAADGTLWWDGDEWQSVR